MTSDYHIYLYNLDLEVLICLLRKYSSSQWYYWLMMMILES